jgi:predicted dehydrogenase
VAELLRWGIVGRGSVAQQFAAGVRSCRTGRVVAVGSRNRDHARSTAHELGLEQGYGTVPELLDNDSVDAVYVATVPSTHAELVEQAAVAGKHVLVEKPLAVTAEQTGAAIAAARTAGVSLVEALGYRFHPQTALLRDLIAEGAIGEVHSIEASCGSFVEPWPSSSRADPALGGGGITAVGCYPVSMARLVAGAAVGQPFLDPEVVDGVASVGETGVDEWAVATCTFATGVTARVAAGVRAGDDNTVKVYGSRGHILVPLPWLVPVDEPGAVVLTTVGVGRRTLQTPAASPYALAVDAIAERTGHEVPEVSWADSLGNARTLDRWREAALNRQPGTGPAHGAQGNAGAVG